MKFKEENILFNKVLARMSPFRDTNFGKMRPNFKCTVYFLSGRCCSLQAIVTQAQAQAASADASSS